MAPRPRRQVLAVRPALHDNRFVAASVVPGDILAEKYRVERVLGIGGMGMVVAAEHVDLHQKVALKFMLAEAQHDAALTERFMREARAAVRLRSEHVARVMDVGHLEDGAPYIVMEFLEGEDLQQLIAKQAPFPVEIAIDYILQACMAMAEAHSVGIIHRDLKPANLFVTQRPDDTTIIKVLDFGISKMRTADEGGIAQTKSSIAMGSPAYMAPEQMRSAKHVDERADVWALGAILYQLLSNSQPYEAESAPVMFAMVLGEDPKPLSSIAPELDPKLCEVVQACLKRRDQRTPSVAHLAAALAPFGDAKAKEMAASISKVVNAQSNPPGTQKASDDAAATVAGKLMSKTKPGDPIEKKDKQHVLDTTRRASAAQVIAAPAKEAPGQAARSNWLAIVIAGAVLATLAVVGSLTLGGGDGTTTAPPSAAAEPEKQSAPSPSAVEPVVMTAPSVDAGSVADARPTTANTTAEAPVKAKPATRKPKRPRSSQTPKVDKVEPKDKPKDKPKAKPKDKPKPDEDVFGTMQ